MFLLPDVYWQIRQTHEKGRGVFATQHISSGIVIGDYLGKVISLADYNPDLEQGMYLMAFGNTMFMYPDMSEPGIYLVNHSCRPNSWMYVYKGHTLFLRFVILYPGKKSPFRICSVQRTRLVIPVSIYVNVVKSNAEKPCICRTIRTPGGGNL